MRSRFGIDLPVMTRALAGGTIVAVLTAAAFAAPADENVAKAVAALQSGDEQTRVAAIDSLGQLGPAAASATGALAEQLSDSSATVRAHAAYALREIGSAASAAAPQLAKAVSDPDFHVRRMAIAALEAIHPDPKIVVEALGKALEDQDPSVRVAALSTLTEYRDSAVPVLSKSLENPQTAYWAALALGQLGAEAKAAVPSLAAALRSKHAPTRREVLLALARIGADSAQAVPQITPLLEDKDPSVRHAAGFALGSIGPAAASAIDELQRTMKSEDDLEACVNCWAIARIQPENTKARGHAIEMLLETVKEKNPQVQSAAIRGLFDLKATPDQIVPALGYVIANGEEPAVGEALGALAMMGDAATDVLVKALSRPEARGRAAMLAAHLGAKAKNVVPALAAALTDENADTRREVLFAIAAVGPDAASAVPALEKSLQDPSAQNRAVAAYALGRIGPKASEALPELQEQLTSDDPLIRVASAFALVHAAPGNEAIARLSVPVLVKGLQSDVAAARRGSAEALGAVGKPARSVAEGALRSATNDPDPTVRKAAVTALEKMGAVVEKSQRIEDRR